MKRRDALKSMAALTAAAQSPAALFAQQAPPPAPQPSDEPAALAPAHPEEVAGPGLHFFTPEEMALFRRLADVLIPRTHTPGALDAGAPEFLDFLLAQSGPERQALYRNGLAGLRSAANLQRELKPLSEPWTPQRPADPLAAFLRAAKEDLWRATVNSRAWALAAEGRRRSGGATYWYPVE